MGLRRIGGDRVSTDRPGPPKRVPTLTEVVEVGSPEAPAGQPAPVPAAATEAAAPAAQRAVPELNEEQIAQRVLLGLQRQVDAIVEQRLRAAVTPALARLTDALVRELRTELASTMREVVVQAVAQELSRHRRR
ncbi:MAG: hypothetical protein E6H58_08235 [Betaproteobacteria bacterium]|nr:MAG: hypothetical protein E6H65_12360 [Betaproteobacteria bacterium]TMH33530.1 MAG: hypothetical protein E6H58_08235 [Betaproteobacteria bacterium]